MRRIVVQLEPDQLTLLDKAAHRRRLSRAALIRELVSQALAEEVRRAELESVVRAYRSAPSEDLTLPKRTRRRAWPE